MMEDLTLRSLKQLPSLAPDTSRASRVVEKCRGKMVRHQRPAKQSPASRVVEFAIVGAFSAIYLLAVARVAFWAYRLS
jgi:hypothetical protein